MRMRMRMLLPCSQPQWMLLLMMVPVLVVLRTSRSSSSSTTTTTPGVSLFAHGFGRPVPVQGRSAPTTAPKATTAFVASASWILRGGGRRRRSVAAVENDVQEEVLPPTTTGLPSWEDLQLRLETRSPVGSSRSGDEKEGEGKEEKQQQPVLTLYRDTNGWCPFCERVWIAIRAKGIPYQETLVSLQQKPDWYKQMVPSGLVPAVLFHENEEKNTTRTLVWESNDILYALDAMFPETTPQLMKAKGTDAAFDAALELQDRVSAAGFQFTYGGRNTSNQTDDDRHTVRNTFNAVLDELDTALGAQQDQYTGGCFRLGPEFSGVDAIMIPTLERWRYQLPLTKDFNLVHNRTHLQRWFEQLETYGPYADRIAGDEYSWTAVTSTFLRFFGGNATTDPQLQAKIEHADRVANDLTKDFGTSFTTNHRQNKNPNTSVFALEAATKLLTNHEAVAADCCREEPVSQKHIPRASSCDRTTVDVLLKYVTSLLIDMAAADNNDGDDTKDAAVVRAGSDGVSSSSSSSLLLSVSIEDSSLLVQQQGAEALRTVATRLCVPRDMGAPAAELLREVLCTVADSLE